MYFIPPPFPLALPFPLHTFFIISIKFLIFLTIMVDFGPLSKIWKQEFQKKNTVQSGIGECGRRGGYDELIMANYFIRHQIKCIFFYFLFQKCRNTIYDEVMLPRMPVKLVLSPIEIPLKNESIIDPPKGFHGQVHDFFSVFPI